MIVSGKTLGTGATILALGGFVWGVATAWASHEATVTRLVTDRDALTEQVRVLRSVVDREFPQYTTELYP